MKITPIKSRFNQFIYRLKTAWRIMFNPKSHWVFISLTDDQLLSLLKNEDMDISFSFHRLQEYNAWKLIKKMADCKDDIDMILGKAAFEAEAEEYNNLKRKKKPE